MVDTTSRERVAHLVEPRDIETIHVLGPTIQFLTPPEVSAPCIMRGTIPPGGVVPLHTHPDPETFLAISGEVEGLSQAGEGFSWVGIKPGDIFHVPGGVKHAFRNQTQAPAVMIVISTFKIGRFFQEVGRLVGPEAGPVSPSAETLQHFLETSERYGYWNATPEENARVGIALSPPA